MRCLALVASIFVALSGSAEAQASLRVATKSAPPFSYKDASGRWTGLSIELWRRISEKAGLPEPRFEECSLEQLLDRVSKGEADAGVAALSITPERERRLDFSHAYYNTGLGIAVVHPRQGKGLWAALEPLLSLELALFLGASLLILLIIGWLIRRFERQNPPFRDESPRETLALGFWWALVVMLGHKGVFPRTLPGRLLMAATMIASLVLLSALIGGFASIFTLSQLERRIRHPQDLRALRVLAIANTSGEDFLRKEKLAYRALPDVKEALRALERDEGDVLLHDAALLGWSIKTTEAVGFRMLAIQFEPQDYAIALPTDSPLRERVNRALLEIRASSAWPELVYRHIGR